MSTSVTEIDQRILETRILLYKKEKGDTCNLGDHSKIAEAIMNDGDIEGDIEEVLGLMKYLDSKI
jgi:hypothetical protein